MQQFQGDLFGISAGRGVAVDTDLGDHAVLFGPLGVGGIRFGFWANEITHQTLLEHTELAPPPPIHTEGILERIADHVGVALLAQPLGQRSGLVREN